MWGCQNLTSLSHYLKKSVSRLLPPLKTTLFEILALLPFFIFLTDPLKSFFCLWMVPWGTLTCEESRTTWFSQKNCLKTAISFKNYPCTFWMFWLVFDVLEVSFEVYIFFSLHGSIIYPDIWDVQNNLILSNNLEISASRPAVFGPCGRSWRLLGSLCGFWWVQ